MFLFQRDPSEMLISIPRKIARKTYFVGYFAKCRARGRSTTEKKTTDENQDQK